MPFPEEEWQPEDALEKRMFDLMAVMPTAMSNSLWRHLHYWTGEEPSLERIERHLPDFVTDFVRYYGDLAAWRKIENKTVAPPNILFRAVAQRLVWCEVGLSLHLSEPTASDDPVIAELADCLAQFYAEDDDQLDAVASKPAVANHAASSHARFPEPREPTRIAPNPTKSRLLEQPVLAWRFKRLDKQTGAWFVLPKNASYEERFKLLFEVLVSSTIQRFRVTKEQSQEIITNAMLNCATAYEERGEDVDNILGVLKTHAHWAALDYFRDEQRRRPESTSAFYHRVGPTKRPEEVAAEREDAQCVITALLTLPARRREVAIAEHVDFLKGLDSQLKVYLMLHDPISIATVYRERERALADLREMLGGEQGLA